MPPSRPSIFIDGHLDLAYNALAVGRDLTLPLEELRAQDAAALVTLPELRRAGVTLVFGTIFVRPAGAKSLGGKGTLEGKAYETPEEARKLALAQLELYERWEEAGEVRIVRTLDDLESHLAASAEDARVGLVLLMENADPLRTPGDLDEWVRRGLHVVGPAWQRTRYAGGTRAPGPLTDLGVELIQAMNETEVTLDVSHFAEESFWSALDLNPVFVIASHSNARSLVPTDRHLSDDMLLALAERDAVVGLVIANPFLRTGVTQDSLKEETTLRDVRRHAEHVAGLIGWERVAIGSDFDGGFGVADVPQEVSSVFDFAKLGEAVPQEVREGFLGHNWLRFLRRVLPKEQ